MPSLEALTPSIVIALLLLVMLWFALGTSWNIRKGNELMRWLQSGLPILGQRTTLRWLGSSAAELRIVSPNAPFREATVVVVLEPRDVGLLWAFAHSRGRRDFLIVRANLERPPRFSADIGDPRGWTGRLGEVETHWRKIDWPGGCDAAVGPGADEPAIRSAWERLSQASEGVWRMTVQPVVPHLEVHLRPPKNGDASRVLGPFRDLAAVLARQ